MRDVRTTRRALFAGSLALLTCPTGVDAAGNRDGVLTIRRRTGRVIMTPEQVADFNLRERFAMTLASLHDHGAMAARRALEAGMRPEWLYTIMLIGDGPAWPALLFRTPEGKHHTFRPQGEDD